MLFRQLNSTRSLKKKLLYQTQVYMYVPNPSTYVYISNIYIYVNRIKDLITKN